VNSLLRVPGPHGESPAIPRSDTERDAKETRGRPRRHLHCRTCGSPVARERDLVTVVGSGAQVFVNPHGLVFEIVTLQRASNVVGVGPRTAEFTWFPGYAWQVVQCGLCAVHLGWVYDAISDASPPRFYGLIRSELRER